MEQQLIENKILTIREQKVILDSDVAELYGVETKRINEAVKNNPDKFPEGYILYLSMDEANSLRSKISTLKNLGRGEHFKYSPKAFSERGLYMLATILKSPQATETTIAIIETFAKVRELSRTISQLPEQSEKEQQKSMMQKSGELISDILNDDFQTVGTETTIEFNLSVLKVKHTVKKKPKE
ncbi:ORF6N domain-containing protein [Petrimonas sulfuriphila]|uniref:ORF6N domain-containing protein n=1 Tax=Petrimonas sulfuriphila TaxID=285070 RepID=UPI003EB9C6D1